ncbi:hypothetical protein EVAR_80606_1 [Eumeta japonica]|uniref:Uncharacterized protein n=1 Tax=Eumeta variegata TaxID=151549 RepID=A0A4C1TMG9_EUMVA|nr:hypothetical protein EVAR_80606_1 [Eumeta japonica]
MLIEKDPLTLHNKSDSPPAYGLPRVHIKPPAAVVVRPLCPRTRAAMEGSRFKPRDDEAEGTVASPALLKVTAAAAASQFSFLRPSECHTAVRESAFVVAMTAETSRRRRCNNDGRDRRLNVLSERVSSVRPGKKATHLTTDSPPSTRSMWMNFETRIVREKRWIQHWPMDLFKDHFQRMYRKRCTVFTSFLRIARTSFGVIDLLMVRQTRRF